MDIGVTANKAPPWLVKYARDIEAKVKERNIAPYTKLDTSDRVLHREWVGLTTAEVIQCQAAYYYDTYQNIEAKLKEKNG